MALPLFAATLFASAFILFLVQPMIGRMILPKLGGTPQVWNTCMVFFQTALLAGYAYTHTSSTRLPVKKQLLLHGVLLLLPFLVLLPILVPGPFDFQTWTPPLGGNPVFSTLWILVLLVGLPFIVVATSAPLLQKWFAHTGHPAAKDPYFLYGASNLGSLLALLAYPLFIEPYLALSSQATFWTVLYALTAALIGVCAFQVYKSPDLPDLAPVQADAAAPVTTTPAEESTAVKAGPVPGAPRKKFGKGKAAAAAAPSIAMTDDDGRIRESEMTIWRRIRWVLLGAAPCSLMLGVTTYICTDLSPIPLLWVVPLSLYLLTFILVFMRWPVVWVGTPHKIVLILQPLFVLLLALYLIERGFSPVFHSGLALLAFFTTALVCHGELARDRPSTRHLTEFYLWMSVGGMLGGMFNGLLAPVLFTGVVEFPLALVVGCLLRPKLRESGWTDDFLMDSSPNLPGWARERGNEMAKAFHKPEPNTPYPLHYALDVILPLLLGCFALLFVYLATEKFGWRNRLDINPLYKFLRALGVVGGSSSRAWAMSAVNGTFRILVYGVPLIICFFYFIRPLRIGLGVGALFIAFLAFDFTGNDEVVYADRSYFGVLRVRQSEDHIGVNRSLMHGTTHHGLNYQTPEKFRRMATTYYHQFGPAGMVMKNYNWFKDGYRGDNANQWLTSMLSYTSDARMPASLTALGAVAAGNSNLPLTQMVALWSEPPYATIGLGTGTMASYARPFQHCHFYEIDNKIRRLSLPEDGGEPYFNYLQGAIARNAGLQVRMGDARLRMAFDYEPYDNQAEINGTAKGGGPDGFYHMMVVDAFSSDAIPIHLITKEAIEMYFKKLHPDGILCVHTSNRHVDLVPVVEAAARSIKVKNDEGGEDELECMRAHDSAGNRENLYGLPGHFTSEWVMVARKRRTEWRGKVINSALEKLDTPPEYETRMKQVFLDDYIKGGYTEEQAAQIVNPRNNWWGYWVRPEDLYGFKPLRYPWTDDYSNVLSVFRW